ncbi:FecR domain-containing protein [Sphingobium sufflavum]|uniref:FecR domain-containing protein n=1 Tax=Sphingobium sufflavum TaxID=1129547 RepID=UPI001F443C3D|nr:FecR domain-containing protein [Sphingobium sufflavum]MCE7797209.1 FecR domain-containing protein [Sphingobium sufflavum]
MTKADGSFWTYGPSYGRLLVGLSLAVAAPVARAQPVAVPLARQVEVAADGTIDYQVRKGEHLYGLARLYFTRQGDFALVQRLNRIADPYRIPTGTRLRIPVRLLRAEPLDAKVQAFRGQVGIRAGAGSAAGTPTVGMAVRPGAIIETGPDGFVGLTLSNGSQLSIPTRSRVRLLAMRRILLTGGVDFDIAVDEGKFETQATPLVPGSGQFRLRTPRAVSAIRGTVLRVGYGADAGQSLTEVLDGSVAVQGAGSGKPALVPKGQGAVVAASGAVRTEALLPAPDLADPAQVLIDPVAAFTVRPLPGARAYHVQVAADAGFGDVVAEATAEGTVVALPALGNGRWFARVSAIAASGLEGESQVYSIRRVLTGLNAAAEQEADRLKFKWAGAGEGRRVYHFQMARGDAKARPMVDEPGLTAQELTLSGMADGVYVWRVGVRQYADGEMVENWLPFQKLTVAGTGR